jgi:hypothetical protein
MEVALNPGQFTEVPVCPGALTNGFNQWSNAQLRFAYLSTALSQAAGPFQNAV